MKTIKIILGLFLMSQCFLACSDYLTLEIPSSQLTGEIVFEDPNTANAALVDIYTKLRDNGMLTGKVGGSSISLGMYTDELIYYGTDDGNVSQIFNNVLLATNPTAQQYWNNGYHQIYCANAVLEGCQNAINLPAEDKQQFVGEASFIRALVHFYLLNLFGEIPFITTTNHEQNKLATPMDKQLVYEKIVADLEKAIELLPENYIDPERVRPVKTTASALLARVYLYQGSWQQAEATASTVINNPAYIWETDLDKIFLKESKTTIWQFSPKSAGDNANEGAVFILASGPPPFVGLSLDLVAAFGENDLRKSHWIGTVTDGESTWHYAYKYKQNTNTGTSLEYSVVMRLAEQYLIRAEAKARQGNLAGAKLDLNKVRNRAGLPNSSATTGEEVILEIMEQRRLEFFTEYGHRFFDLKRTGRSNTILPSSKPGWDDKDNLWPIPEAEVLANPNMTQNPGY